MADKEHVKRIRQGANVWNDWRSQKFVVPDFTGADFSGFDFSWMDLEDADFSAANISKADFFAAQLHGAVFDEADLSEARLFRVSVDLARMRKANLKGATLAWGTFRRVDMEGADLTEATLASTVFSLSNLSNVVGLETCKHLDASSIDYATLYASGRLPLQFLRGVGLPENFIDYLPSFLNEPIQFYSCFISYSTRDQLFADQLHADAQNCGIRVWFAPHDMPIGGIIWDEVDAAIRVRDKLLLILSEHSIKSDWVEDEVTKAFEEERRRGQTVLFPIRLDDAVMETNEAWAAKLRARHIGDFTRWKEHDEYQKSFARVLRDLTVKKL